ncbi:unnamed protein product [Mytilus coruscus]|uniref:Uncharacterized protein n=1 Tax=Mytilus coruscus TaxID=42192 RepID=A0A6J8B4G6_MYTCO|nr:unnamed protein product [Mytilus coruscus]
MYAGIRVLCPTRWTVKADAMIAIINNYESLKKLWEWSLYKLKDTDMKARVRGVEAHMQRFDFFFGLSQFGLGECLLRTADNLSAGLQTKDLSAAEGKKVTKFAQLKGVDEPCLPRQKRMPTRLETGNAEPHYHETPEGYFRQIYLEAVDYLRQTQQASDHLAPQRQTNEKLLEKFYYETAEIEQFNVSKCTQRQN